jgi:hypothetical protein
LTRITNCPPGIGSGGVVSAAATYTLAPDACDVEELACPPDVGAEEDECAVLREDTFEPEVVGDAFDSDVGGPSDPVHPAASAEVTAATPPITSVRLRVLLSISSPRSATPARRNAGASLALVR